MHSILDLVVKSCVSCQGDGDGIVYREAIAKSPCKGTMSVENKGSVLLETILCLFPIK